MNDDLPAALARARREKKLVFVDAWAPWCHTCLSMKHFVLDEPSLTRFESDIVFVAIDTDREQNAAFVERYAIDVWPTLYVLEPSKGEVVGYWPGAASLRELEHFLEDAVALHAMSASAGGLRPGSADAHLLDARRHMSAERHRQAATSYEAAVKAAPAEWKRRSEALFGWLKALHHSGQAKPCVNVGEKYAREVQGAALPADFARYWFSCAKGIKVPAAQSAVRKAALARMTELVESPPPDASYDDRADALEILADALETLGRKPEVRTVHEKRAALLERAAREAPSPQAAATYDYARAVTYRALGQPEKAVEMLQARVRELPDSYEPAARLASVLYAMRRNQEALEAVDKALTHAYGPRRLRYLELKANIQRALGDRAGQIATLEQEVAGWKELAARSKTPPAGLDAAQKRLTAARR